MVISSNHLQNLKGTVDLPHHTVYSLCVFTEKKEQKQNEG